MRLRGKKSRPYRPGWLVEGQAGSGTKHNIKYMHTYIREDRQSGRQANIHRDTEAICIHTTNIYRQEGRQTTQTIMQAYRPAYKQQCRYTE